MRLLDGLTPHRPLLLHCPHARLEEHVTPHVQVGGNRRQAGGGARRQAGGAATHALQGHRGSAKQRLGCARLPVGAALLALVAAPGALDARLAAQQQVVHLRIRRR